MLWKVCQLWEICLLLEITKRNVVIEIQRKRGPAVVGWSPYLGKDDSGVIRYCKEREQTSQLINLYEVSIHNFVIKKES